MMDDDDEFKDTRTPRTKLSSFGSTSIVLKRNLSRVPPYSRWLPHNFKTSQMQNLRPLVMDVIVKRRSCLRLVVLKYYETKFI